MRPEAARRCVALLLPVFFHVRLTGFLGVVRRVMTMTTGSVRVMGSLFVLPALIDDTNIPFGLVWGKCRDAETTP
jgi:hypothetical protein